MNETGTYEDTYRLRVHGKEKYLVTCEYVWAPPRGGSKFLDWSGRSGQLPFPVKIYLNLGYYHLCPCPLEKSQMDA